MILISLNERTDLMDATPTRPVTIIDPTAVRLDGELIAVLDKTGAWHVEELPDESAAEAKYKKIIESLASEAVYLAV